MDLTLLLAHVVESGASDVHLKLGRPPLVRHDGAIDELAGWAPLDSAALEGVLDTLTTGRERARASFDETGELDLGHESAGVRFRVNVFRQRGAISLAIRVIPREVPTLEGLSMPAGVRRLAEEHRGLILVTGATGSGKSTTLAGIVDHINRSRSAHVITIEDPVETLFEDARCIINQREVGLDTASFGQALRRALRQDPDVILIGELRDSETAETALQAAESGHLVLSTMHTLDAAETVGRMSEFFPAVKQPMIRSILSTVLKGVVSQRLLPKIGGGRAAAVEVMVVNDRVADLIRENRPEELPGAMKDGLYYDMQPLVSALIELTLAGTVDRETAAAAAPNRHDFLLTLQHAERSRAAESPAAVPSEVPPSPVVSTEPWLATPQPAGIQ